MENKLHVKKSPFGNSINDFKIIESLGSGGFAEVFKARCTTPGYENTYVAIKKICKKVVCKKKCQDRIDNEIKIHSHLPSHPAFVQFYTHFEDNEYWYFILELCAGRSLEEYINRIKQEKDVTKENCLPEKEAIKLIKQVIEGVKYLHSKLIIHRDLTLKNLLLDADCHHVKIADFGLAVKLNHPDEEKNTMLGTPYYMPPEVFNHDFYNFKADCWSVGIVLYALLYGSPPFKNSKDIKKSVQYSELKFPSYASKEAKELLRSLLKKNPSDRIDLKDALKFAFFQQNEKFSRNKINYQKGIDSGMSSLSSFESKRSQFAHTSVEYNHNSNRSKKEKRIISIKSAPITRYQCDNRRFGCQNNQSQDLYQNRYESQYDTPVKSRPECPSYPDDLRYLAERNLNAQIYSDYDSLISKNHSIKHNKSTYQQSSCVKNNADDGIKEFSCSHDKHCIPENNCFHELSCCCQQMRYNFCVPLSNYENENKNYIDKKTTDVEKCLKDPLNTARISCRRKEIEKKDVIISILSDGRVCLEYLKLKRSKKFVHVVYLISENGLEVIVYKPKKKILLNPDQPPPIPHNGPEVQYFTFVDLPSIYWKKYQFAKYFVDKVRGITPKVTIYGKNATCIMMENSPNPNYEMNFYNGFQITKIGHKVNIKDKNGCIVTTNNDAINSMLKEFEDMKQKCEMLEKNIESFHDSNFPVVLGKKPDNTKKIVIQDSNKENVSPICLKSSSLNGLNSTVKHCEITISKENRPFENTFQRSSSIPYSDKKSISSFKNTSNSLSHLKSLKVEKEMVIAEYRDGIQMYISMQDDTKFFTDANKQIISSPHLMERFENDSRDILRYALLKEVKQKI